MRISSSYQFDTYARDVRLSQEKYFESQNSVMTGRRINKMSDDPFGTATALNMRSLKAGATQYQANLTTGKNILTYTEASLGDAYSIMRDSYQVALQAGTDTTDQAARDALSSQVDSIQKQLLQLANSQGPNGQYIYAGQTNDKAPFTVTASAGTNPLALPSGLFLNYQGDSTDVTIESGPGQTMAINTKGENMFKKAYQALDQLKIDLQGGNISSISGVDIQNIQNSMKELNTERGYVGSKLQSVTMLTDHYTKRVDDLTSGISDVEEVDMAAAIQQYQLAQNAYNAALTVAGQGFKLSLMDFIQG